MSISVFEFGAMQFHWMLARWDATIPHPLERLKKLHQLEPITFGTGKSVAGCEFCKPCFQDGLLTGQYILVILIMASEWCSGLRHCISVQEASLTFLLGFFCIMLVRFPWCIDSWVFERVKVRISGRVSLHAKQLQSS